MPTPQDNAIAAAQNLSTLMAQYIIFTNAVAAWQQDNAKNNWDQYWISMPTVAVKPDGSIGANDATPNNDHPINVPSESPILMSRGSLINAVNLIASLQSLSSWETGAVIAPNQNPLITAAVLAPNQLG